MDEWTHPHHGPDGNLVSTDKAISFPLGLRWIDGVPVNVAEYGSCRSVVLAGGRCFTVSLNDLGNLRSAKKSAYLTARDAYCGFPLWRINCEVTYDARMEVDWRNVWPLVATDRRMYTANKDSLLILDAATGKIETTCATKYQPRRLLLLDGCLVTSGWEGVEQSQDGYDGAYLRRQWWPTGAGTVAAFDAENGTPKWTLPFAAYEMVASGGTVYLLTHKGNPPTERQVVAVELTTGKEKWRVPHTAFDTEPAIYLSVAGPDCAVVSKFKGKREVLVLSAADGKVLCKIPDNSTPRIVGGDLWCSNGRYDLKTGAKTQGGGILIHYGSSGGVDGCIPTLVVGGRYVTYSRYGKFFELPDSAGKQPTARSYQGARGACIQGMVPANGMFYTAQNYCGCYTAQPYGFLAIGPCGDIPTAEEFEKPRPVEKGPAFGAVEPLPSTDDWPTYRHDAERGAGISTSVPDELKMLWKVECAKPGQGQFGEAWNARMGLPQPLSAPVVAAGMVFVARINAGQVVALNPATGATIWTATLGSRIDTPPTIYKGLCLVGCHDGWVYALRAKDGALAYRLRIAPRERRMVAHGTVESVWPATGAVLVHDGIAYVTAGRSTETDGGIALVAFKPETGETLWAKGMGEKLVLLQDILSVQNGELAWHWLRMDLKTGSALASAQRFSWHSTMLDGAWAAGFYIRVGRGFMLGRVCDNMMAWNDQLVVTPSFAVSRAKVEVPKPPPNSAFKHPDPFKRDELAWTPELEPASAWVRVHAMALTGNAALFAGPVFNGYQGGRYDGSFLWMKSVVDGKKQQATTKLDAPPAYDGLAVTGGRVYLALQNGVLICWAK